MKKFWNVARTFIGVALVVLAIVCIYAWETVGRMEFMYDDVVVLKQDVEEGTIITADMLGALKVENSYILKESITDPNAIIGKSAANYVPAFTQIVPEYFQDAALTLKDGEYILSVPSSWIVAYPQTLRRLDTVYFYAIKPDKDSVTYDAYGNPVIKTATGEKSGVICKATVAYAKDGSNQEIYSADEDRLSGTGNVSLVEIICTMEDADLMAKYIEDGYAFVLLYN